MDDKEAKQIIKELEESWKQSQKSKMLYYGLNLRLSAIFMIQD